MIVPHCLRHTSMIGARSILRSATRLRNTGVSRIRSRIHKSYAYKHNAERKWDAPAQVQKCIAVDLAEDENGKVGQKQAGGTAELWPGRQEAAFIVVTRP